MKLLNVGCGAHFHPEWTNVDFYSTGTGVIAHNLLEGIPFESDSFDAVYHSHVLEHFSKSDGKKLLAECFRVLKPGGILRIAIPDLEKIVTAYREITDKLKHEPQNPKLNANYDWIMIELLDQCVRSTSGGEMLKYLRCQNLLNKEYVIDRCGYEVKPLIEAAELARSAETTTIDDRRKLSLPNIKRIMGYLKNKLKESLLKRMLGTEYSTFYNLGKFRLSGEIHQWMYDEFSIKRLLVDTGFSNPQRHSAYSSNIPAWGDYGLETIDNAVRKPDSLFIEAIK